MTRNDEFKTVRGTELTDSSTPFDDVFKTMLTKVPELVLPLLNEIFGTSYDDSARIERSPNEHFVVAEGGRESKQITDSTFVVHGRRSVRYHLECQSTEDGDMIVRMTEYDLHVGLSDGRYTKEKMIVPLPRSAVLYLRGGRTRPSETLQVEIRSGERSMLHEIRTMRVQRYGLSEIFRKNLLFLTPFHLMRYEDRLKEMAGDDRNPALSQMLSDCRIICSQLQNPKYGKMELTTYQKWLIIELTKKIVAAMCKSPEYHRIQGEVDQIMGGNVIETEADRILEQGIEQGVRQGIEQGVRQGIEQGVKQESKRNQEQLTKNVRNARAKGIPDETIAICNGVDPAVIKAM